MQWHQRRWIQGRVQRIDTWTHPARDNGGVGPSLADGSTYGATSPSDGAVGARSRDTGCSEVASLNDSKVGPSKGPREATAVGLGPPYRGPYRKDKGWSIRDLHPHEQLWCRGRSQCYSHERRPPTGRGSGGTTGTLDTSCRGIGPPPLQRTSRKGELWSGAQIPLKASVSPTNRAGNALSMVCTAHTVGKPQSSLPSTIKKCLLHSNRRSLLRSTLSSARSMSRIACAMAPLLRLCTP
ncbi:hypothetical protein B296_00054846 [Ensete ventricosum]|uniref:Uncharacterized protein n=1 Tax=Ensete ventricosum TaxID=4639 RepID=A0A426XZ03_ENSVE|nr:hypothetical protein B296_00054846 [Ensete ventricosum]